MDAELTPLYVTLGLFSLGVLPLLVDNLRTGRATNRNNGILAIAGLASTGINHGFGWDQQPLWVTGGWIAFGVIGLFILTAKGILPGGVAKTMMALLPWFTTTDYLLVIGAGLILAILLALALGRRVVPVTAPLVLSSFGVWLHEFGGYF
jgi:hypothetical protein